MELHAADVSGSMEPYSRFLLHFIYSLTVGLPNPIESFVFSTKLTRITKHLRKKELIESLKAVSRNVNDWSGGTRIGDAIKRFNYHWSRRVNAHGGLILIISDGWDRGSLEELKREISRLQRICHKLIWLNPLLGSHGYEPLTQGMQAALPHIDEFLPAHNLAGLEDLASLLAISQYKTISYTAPDNKLRTTPPATTLPS